MPMMTAAELRDRCAAIRRGSQGGAATAPGLEVVDDTLVCRIEADVLEYRRFLTAPQPQLPPDELAERLPLMGWLLLEASLKLLWIVKVDFESLAGPDGEASRAKAALIVRLADAARRLPWPEFAPRALGAIRAQALVQSKRDVESGYDEAWILHEEARKKCSEYADSHGDSPERERFLLDFDEVLLQLALAETGTACRTAERVIGRWAEELEKPDPAWTELDSPRWTQRMFRELADGVAKGERALAVADKIGKGPGFAYRVTERRLALPTSLRNPAIMTCRALLLVYSMCPEMRDLGRTPEGFSTWEEYQRDLLRRFDRAFAHLRRPVRREDGSGWPLEEDHLRSMVQLCLHLALLTPGHRLEEPLRVDATLTLEKLDEPAVEAICHWLAEPVGGKAQRGDANLIGSASKPSFIRSVEDCREDSGRSADYRRWRLDWFKLDRYAEHPGRRERIEQIMGL